MNLAPLLIPVVIVGLALTLLGVVITFARNYVKCAPNEVLVVFGRRRAGKGYRLITGGATFIWPVFEAYQRISLDTFQVEFAIEDSPNIDGVPVTVQALANLKISSEPALLANAVERLLELGNDAKRLEQLSRSTLEGQLRMIVGTLKVEEIIQDREKISGQVLNVSKGELNKLGLEVDIFVIQKISDSHGYIEALGKKATAEVKRDAAIGEAEATRDSKIRTAEADRDARQRAAVANQEASVSEAQAALTVSDANRNRDEQIAKNDARVQSEQARISIAAQTAAAQEGQLLAVAEVAAKEAEIQARIKLQEKERERKDAELRASVIVTAERDKEALLIRAGAEQEAAVMQGEAARVRKEKEGEGERAFLTAQAIGRKAAAEADLAEQQAAANGQKAQLLATAEGARAQGEAEGIAIRARGEAEGDAVRARLLAEAEGSLKAQMAIAEGILKKNEAMTRMSPEALRILTLELLPEILTHGGEALEKALGAAMEPVGQGLAAVDSIHVLDMGNGNGAAGSPLSKITGAAPGALMQLITGLRAVGVDPSKFLNFLGMDASKFDEMFGGAIARDPPRALTSPSQGLIMENSIAPIDAGPAERYTSTVPWTDTAADCVVVCCSDPRFEQQNEEFVKAQGFSQPHFMQIPSGVAVFASLVAAAGFLHKGMGLLLKKAIDLTGVDTVICIGHEDCGGYRAGRYEIVQAVSRRLRGKPVREIQHDHLEKAGRTISRQLGRDVQVRVYYADVVQSTNGDFVKYSPVGHWSGGRPTDRS